MFQRCCGVDLLSIFLFFTRNTKSRDRVVASVGKERSEGKISDHFWFADERNKWERVDWNSFDWILGYRPFARERHTVDTVRLKRRNTFVETFKIVRVRCQFLGNCRSTDVLCQSAVFSSVLFVPGNPLCTGSSVKNKQI